VSQLAEFNSNWAR